MMNSVEGEEDDAQAEQGEILERVQEEVCHFWVEVRVGEG